MRSHGVRATEGHERIGVCVTLLHQTPINDIVPRRVLNSVFRHRRLTAPEHPCAARPCETCYAVHSAKLTRFIELDLPIHFVMPAFPAKSPNQRKVLGALPDLAERLALKFLQSFCDEIAEVHPPGARVTICSDGHVFGDLVGVSDDAVTRYREELDAMAADGHLRSIDLFGLDDAFGNKEYPSLRDLLERRYAPTLKSIRENVRHDDDWRSLFNGIHRFIFEDQVGLGREASRTAIRCESKDVAYQTIRRSNAWTAVVAERFPEALRLSIHPQKPHAEKIGFQILRAPDNWLTPWHGVILRTHAMDTLIKRHDAERLNARLVYRDDRPDYFVLPSGQTTERNSRAVLDHP